MIRNKRYFRGGHSFCLLFIGNVTFICLLLYLFVLILLSLAKEPLSLIDIAKIWGKCEIANRCFFQILRCFCQSLKWSFLMGESVAF